MSYSIIFETKIVRLSDGRIIHFSLDGCNNDNSGRNRDEFHAKIYEADEFLKMARSYQEHSKPYKDSDGFDLKIGSRYATYYDYGAHLIRMYNHAKPYEEFLQERYVRADVLESIDLLEPEAKHFDNPQDFNFYDYIDKGSVKYRSNWISPDVRDEEKIVSYIESGKPISFYIGRRED